MNLKISIATVMLTLWTAIASCAEPCGQPACSSGQCSSASGSEQPAAKRTLMPKLWNSLWGGCQSGTCPIGRRPAAAASKRTTKQHTVQPTACTNGQCGLPRSAAAEQNMPPAAAGCRTGGCPLGSSQQPRPAGPSSGQGANAAGQSTSLARQLPRYGGDCSSGACALRPDHAEVRPVQSNAVDGTAAAGFSTESTHNGTVPTGWTAAPYGSATHELELDQLPEAAGRLPAHSSVPSPPGSSADSASTGPAAGFAASYSAAPTAASWPSHNGARQQPQQGRSANVVLLGADTLNGPETGPGSRATERMLRAVGEPQRQVVAASQAEAQPARKWQRRLPAVVGSLGRLLAWQQANSDEEPAKRPGSLFGRLAQPKERFNRSARYRTTHEPPATSRKQSGNGLWNFLFDTGKQWSQAVPEPPDPYRAGSAARRRRFNLPAEKLLHGLFRRDGPDGPRRAAAGAPQGEQLNGTGASLLKRLGSLLTATAHRAREPEPGSAEPKLSFEPPETATSVTALRHDRSTPAAHKPAYESNWATQATWNSPANSNRFAKDSVQSSHSSGEAGPTVAAHSAATAQQRPSACEPEQYPVDGAPGRSGFETQQPLSRHRSPPSQRPFLRMQSPDSDEQGRNITTGKPAGQPGRAAGQPVGSAYRAELLLEQHAGQRSGRASDGWQPAANAPKPTRASAAGSSTTNSKYFGAAKEESLPANVLGHATRADKPAPTKVQEPPAGAGLCQRSTGVPAGIEPAQSAATQSSHVSEDMTPMATPELGNDYATSGSVGSVDSVGRDHVSGARAAPSGLTPRVQSAAAKPASQLTSLASSSSGLASGRPADQAGWWPAALLSVGHRLSATCARFAQLLQRRPIELLLAAGALVLALAALVVGPSRRGVTGPNADLLVDEWWNGTGALLLQRAVMSDEGRRRWRAGRVVGTVVTVLAVAAIAAAAACLMQVPSDQNMLYVGLPLALIGEMGILLGLLLIVRVGRQVGTTMPVPLAPAAQWYTSAALPLPHMQPPNTVTVEAGRIEEVRQKLDTISAKLERLESAREREF